MLSLIVRLSTLVAAVARPVHHRLHRAVPGERGQATTEYALVLLGAAAIALLLAAWAAKTGAFSRLFDAVVGNLVDKVG